MYIDIYLYLHKCRRFNGTPSGLERQTDRQTDRKENITIGGDVQILIISFTTFTYTVGRSVAFDRIIIVIICIQSNR